jgi:hypothetical protein
MLTLLSLFPPLYVQELFGLSPLPGLIHWWFLHVLEMFGFLPFLMLHRWWHILVLERLAIPLLPEIAF